ncbi:MAG: PHP domain-containing protein [Candidatus Gastranaerophilales bacterium]|nr:PHP domain-containing protein [Candidatus Gastranaerophilales bacterium]
MLDLHIHSKYSDGNLSPEDIVDAAIELGMTAISISDHDNVLSYQYANAHIDMKSQEAGKKVLEIIPGVEINTLWNGHEIHILGYLMDISSKPFLDLLLYQQHARAEQTVQIVEKLRKLTNMGIKLEDITSLVAEGGSIGRPHIARAISNAGGTRNIIEAYNKYINDNAPTYVKRKTVSPHDAVEIIYEAGGIPVIAHPCDLVIAEELIKDLMNYGLRGIEAYHRKHSPAMVEYYSTMAEHYGLVVTGGSDCHGTKVGKQLFLGKNFVPDWILEGLRKEKSRIEIASC